LVGLPENQAVDGSPAGKEDKRKGNCHRDAEAKPDHINEKRRREGGEDVASKVNVAEGDVAEEADGDVDPTAQVDCSLHHIVHLRGCGVRQGSVHCKDVRLAGECEGEDGEALEHARGAPQVHLRHPLSRRDVWCRL